MHLLKLTLSFFTTGGATWALISFKEAPQWMKGFALILGLVAFVQALVELPHALHAVEETKSIVTIWLQQVPKANANVPPLISEPTSRVGK